jgi:hypothetical protein
LFLFGAAINASDGVARRRRSAEVALPDRQIDLDLLLVEIDDHAFEDLDAAVDRALETHAVAELQLSRKAVARQSHRAAGTDVLIGDFDKVLGHRVAATQCSTVIDAETPPLQQPYVLHEKVTAALLPPGQIGSGLNHMGEAGRNSLVAGDV